MTTTVFTLPGTGSNVNLTGNAWTTPSNITTVANSTTVDMPKSENSDWLVASNFGFNIPTDATIYGIEVRVNREAELGDDVADNSLRLYNGTSLVGDDKASATLWATGLSAPETVTYGTANDNWNAGLTPTQVNSAGFGVYLSAANTDTIFNGIAYVEYIEVSITYDNPQKVYVDTATVTTTTVKVGIDYGAPLVVNEYFDQASNGNDPVVNLITPTAGNVIIISFGTWFVSDTSQIPISWGLPSGFTLIIQKDSSDVDGTNINQESVGIAYKISDGTESSLSVAPWISRFADYTYLWASEVQNLDNTNLVADTDFDIDTDPASMTVTPANENSFYIGSQATNAEQTVTGYTYSDNFTQTYSSSPPLYNIGYKTGATETSQSLTITPVGGSYFSAAAVMVAFNAAPVSSATIINIDTANIQSTTIDNIINDKDNIAILLSDVQAVTANTTINSKYNVLMDLLSTQYITNPVNISNGIIILLDLLTNTVNTNPVIVNATDNIEVQQALVQSSTNDVKIRTIQHILIDLLTSTITTNDIILNEKYNVQVQQAIVQSSTNDITINEKYRVLIDLLTSTITTNDIIVNNIQKILLEILTTSVSINDLSILLVNDGGKNWWNKPVVNNNWDNTNINTNNWTNKSVSIDDWNNNIINTNSWNDQNKELNDWSDKDKNITGTKPSE